MATIGDQLSSPESGWKRYDNTDSRVSYTGSWTHRTTLSDNHNSTDSYTSTQSDKITFKFYGTKFRIISMFWSTFSNNVQVKVDNVINGTYSSRSSLNQYKILLYEIKDLDQEVHTVEIAKVDATSTDLYLDLDCIDIDDTGYLVHPILSQVSDISIVKVGDCIPCRYTATTSGVAGYFSELGTCDAAPIPVAGTSTPDGLFYFIKTDKGTLIADRVIQTYISWDTLNAAKYIEGTGFTYLEDKTDNSGVIIDSYSSYWGGYPPESMFDKIMDAGDSGWHPANNSSANNCTFHFSGSVIFNKIVLTCRNSSYVPVNFKLYGVNQLGNKELINVYKSQNDKILTCYTSNLISSYNKFYIEMDAGYFCIGEIEFYNEKKVSTVRSLSGGCSYSDESGKSSTTNKSLGGWPTNNDWDKYIVNSDLNGKITKADDNIWNWKNLHSACKDTSITSIQTSGYRSYRGTSPSGSNNPMFQRCNNYSSYFGFRPMLNYLEPNSKATNLYY